MRGIIISRVVSFINLVISLKIQQKVFATAAMKNLNYIIYWSPQIKSASFKKNLFSLSGGEFVEMLT